MQAAQIATAGGDFELVEREAPAPERHEVRIKVEACGVCHSDAFVKDGGFPGLEYPRIPGHEVVGRIDQLGADVAGWSDGQRVGVGWHGGHCFRCESCRRGDFVTCENAKIAGISYDGGYAEYMCVPAEALVAIPDALEAIAAAPLLCAGVTTYNALRNSGANAGDVVAVQGLGGLGHLAVQFAAKMGFYTVAISGSDAKSKLARDLGADHYIDAGSGAPDQALQKLGGAKVILTTAPNAKAMSAMVDGLAVNGRLVVVGATPDVIEVSPFQLIMQRRSIAGWPSGTPHDSEDTLNFSTMTNIRAEIETFPLAEVAKAYQRMISNEARFRIVLTMQ